MHTHLIQTEVLARENFLLVHGHCILLKYCCVKKVKLDNNTQTLYCFKNVYVIVGNCLETFSIPVDRGG